MNRNRNWNNGGYGDLPRSSRGGYNRDNNGNRGRRNFQKFADVQNREDGAEQQRGGGQDQQWWKYKHNYRNSNQSTRKFRGTSNWYNDGEQGGTYQNDQNCDGGYSGKHQQMCEDGAEYFEEHQSVPSTLNPDTHDRIAAGKNSISTNDQISTGKDSTLTNVPVSPHPDAAPVADKPTKLINIKKENQEMINLKAERKSSSSSSSSSDSSSNESETENPKVNNLGSNLKPPPTVKLKHLTASTGNTTNTPSVTAKNKPPPVDTSSSSEEEQPTTKKRCKAKGNLSSEEDVVCMGKLENKIVLDDDEEDDDESETDCSIEDEDSPTTSKPTNPKKQGKKLGKKTVEECMLCDKEGHTSFQCQMICKNCSGPYHGFRTCPHPANLNTMLQLFMEFCMQQLQQFQTNNQFQQLLCHTNTTGSVPQPLVGSPTLNATSKKSGKRKKHTKTKVSSKVVLTKKRKLTAKKTSANDDSENTTPDSDETSDSDDDSSSEGFKSPANSKKKKSKSKHKSNLSVPALNLANFMHNYPINFNGGIPNMTAAPANPQLNTLLLTQMFQNAIGSMTNKHS